MKSFSALLLLLLVLCSCSEVYDRTAFTNVRIIDGNGGNPIENGILIISGGKIESVGKDVNIPEGYKKIDLQGKTVLPGFINSHVHDAYDKETLQRWLKLLDSHVGTLAGSKRSI